MADEINFRQGRPGDKPVKYKDLSADGSFGEEVGADLYGWDATSLGWTKIPVDHTTGGLKVFDVGGGPVSVVSSGTQLVSQASSVTITSGSTVNVNVASQTDSSTRNINLASYSTTSTINVNVASLTDSGTQNVNVASFT